MRCERLNFKANIWLIYLYHCSIIVSVLPQISTLIENVQIQFGKRLEMLNGLFI
jgi:hypothetical protein